ncbi:NAD(P)/FAD-dependent oxidoreductase [Streptomyces botrytidirepellens]|uniref:NAD(P)/FAD-dependent oxidoreductase n=1 Tax=Streptomyces botrytidirepellens TaxID=2486417 RepID=UPI001FECCDC8|nr:FAD-dependent oxidoreductase [Streptomyces botrytidirepellens]
MRSGLHCAKERHLDPVSLVKGREERCRELGVRFLHNSRVTDIRSRGGAATSLLAAGEEIHGDLFVLAAGAHTGPLARLGGCPLPIQPGKRDGFDDITNSVTLRHSVYLGEAKVAVTPLSDRLRFAGTMEFGSSDATIDPHRVRGIARAARDFLPGYAPTQQPRTWTGHPPTTPDGLPAIGAVAGQGQRARRQRTLHARGDLGADNRGYHLRDGQGRRPHSRTRHHSPRLRPTALRLTPRSVNVPVRRYRSSRTSTMKDPRHDALLRGGAVRPGRDAARPRRRLRRRCRGHRARPRGLARNRS